MTAPGAAEAGKKWDDDARCTVREGSGKGLARP